MSGSSLSIRVLDVAAGEMFHRRPSGCGKSTLLRLIAGLDFRKLGRTGIGGEPITGPSAVRGLVFKSQFVPWLTVRKNFKPADRAEMLQKSGTR